MESQGRKLFFLLISLSLIVTVRSQLAPVFINNMNNFYVPESTKIDEVVYTLYAEDPEGFNVTYGMKADMFAVNNRTGEVRLTRPVDYETGEKILRDIKTYAYDTVDGTSSTADIVVNVRDSNDIAPRFSAETYKITIPENQPVNSIISDLSVTDQDFPNSPLSVSCIFEDESYKEACDTFRINQLETNNRRWRGNLELVRPVDYEIRQSYQLSLQTFDGVNRRDQSFEISLEDINDSPPKFERADPATVNESIPLNTTVNVVLAVDGDENSPNEIRYELNCTTNEGINLFTIDRVSGAIINTRLLDRESVELSLGYLDLCVKAREVIGADPEVLGNDPSTTATATVRINVLDVNDNSPSFHQSEFTVDIREDIPNESSLPGLILTVSDLDLGTGNSYQFVLLNHTLEFAVSPTTGQGRTTATIRVIDTSLIDYEKGPNKYILEVEAREILPGQISRLTGSATVTVNVLDVNDNYPQFTQPDYRETVLETANIGTTVVKVSVIDPDSGNFGVDGVRYGLFGNGAEKFRIGSQSGIVTVAPCNNVPGKDDCLNFETKRSYALTVRATDELGLGLTNTARLMIDILDFNDNPPEFTSTEYVEYINEGETETVNPLVITATDLDTVGGPIRYRIENTGPASLLWQIDPLTALVTARAPIRYDSLPANREYFELSVLAEDDTFDALVPVKIYVIDRNDNAPVFDPRIYTETIDENTLGNVVILTVTATDEDSPTTVNGRIEYGIETGGGGKFVINGSTGVISTASDAEFDYDQVKQYQLSVRARDGGNPQLTGTATVIINIRDVNDENPYFRPQTDRAQVYENVPIGTSVTFVKAFDVDVGAVLNYYFVEPIDAITPGGIRVDRNIYNYADLFEIEESTGIVRTKRNLDRDLTMRVTYTLSVLDISAATRQNGTGKLIIDILEYNDQNPYFQQPFYNITIDEEQPIGAFVMTLIAQDEDDEIQQYEIFDERGNYFAIAPATGVLTVRNNIDYEKVQQTSFKARATDSGFPPLTATTSVLVNIRNINDNSPIFDRTDYSATIPEHSPPTTSVITVRAEDQDLGDYGVVRYRLSDGESRFSINSVSGEITTIADLDRERESFIAIQVTAYDSPLDESVRRRYTVPVYITLSDINDNSPIFTSTEYETTVIETIDIGAPILRVFANDADAGTNALIAFTKLSGDPSNYFEVGRSSGRIIVSQSLRGRTGDYVLYVLAQDQNGSPLSRNDTAKVTIHVIEATNSPPVWEIPPRDNMTIDVLETQYLGMLVYDVEAVDNDNGMSGVVDYGFYYKGIYTRKTPEFSINRVTGVIRAEIRYDREAIDRYVLLLSARDRGDPSLEAIRFLTVRILDVNDNVPEFPMTNGETIPYDFSVAENATVGTVIGSVLAIDRDTIDTVYYYILAGDRNLFGINVTTGAIFLKQKLDREVLARHTLDIQATNNISDYTVIRERRKRSTDPSIVTVRVTVVDVEDEEPVFTSFNGPNNKKEYYGCISETAPFGRSVVQIAATDADAAGPAGLRYALGGENTDGTFAIDPSTGLIYNILLLDKDKPTVFLMSATATDKGGLTTAVDVKVFKTTAANEAKIVINQESSEVRLFIQQLVRLLEAEKDIQYVCVTNIRDHVDGNGRIDRTKTDVYVTAVYGAQSDYRIYSTDELISLMIKDRINNRNSYDALYITDLGTVSEEGSLLQETPVLAVLIIVVLLIVMAFILFCLACYCISDSKKRKLRKTEAERFTVVSQEPVKTVSPVYDNPGFEREPMQVPAPTPAPVQYSPNDEYAVVQKKRPPSDELVPTSVVPVQAAQPIIQTIPDEPEEGPIPVIETVVMEEERPVQQPYDEGPVIVTEILPDPEAVYIPEPEPKAVYIPEPEPETVYIPEPEPQADHIPEPEPQIGYVPEPEPPHLEYITESDPEPFPDPNPEPSTSYSPVPEDGSQEIIVEIQDSPNITPRHSPPPSPKYSPPGSRSPSLRRSPSPSPRQSPAPSQKDEDDLQMTTEVM